jgi:DNA-directed RNA polymerase subunit RPC12/RpoP
VSDFVSYRDVWIEEEKMCSAMRKDSKVFRDASVLVTNELKDFVKSVNLGTASGLQISISEFPEIYGELQSHGSSEFHISPANGPCYIICAECGVEFDEQTMASLGTNSVMAAFGAKPVIACKECGSKEMIIVRA